MATEKGNDGTGEERNTESDTLNKLRDWWKPAIIIAIVGLALTVCFEFCSALQDDIDGFRKDLQATKQTIIDDRDRFREDLRAAEQTIIELAQRADDQLRELATCRDVQFHLLCRETGQFDTSGGSGCIVNGVSVTPENRLFMLGVLEGRRGE